METEPERSFLIEAQMILKGLTGLLPEKRHLEALEEYREVTIIRMVNALELVKQQFLNGKE
jgi:hypothetical protein